MRHCKHCHTCGEPLRVVLDGEEWCSKCDRHQRYRSHGFSDYGWNDDDECYFDAYEAAYRFIMLTPGYIGPWAAPSGRWEVKQEEEL